MAGVKGRSGRKSRSDEAKRLAVIDRAWQLIAQALNSDIPDKEKYVIAKDIILKDITQKVEGKGFESKTIFQKIVVEGKTAEQLINDINQRLSSQFA